MKNRKKYGVPNRSCDPAILPSREKGPKRAFLRSINTALKPERIKIRPKIPTEKGKSHLLKRDFLNGRIWFVSSKARVFKRYSNDWAIWVVGLAAFKSNVGKF